MRLPFQKEKKQPDAPVVNAWDTSADPTDAPAENQAHNNSHPNDTAHGGISEKTEQPPTPQNDPSSPAGSKTATPDPNQMHTRGASIDIPPQEMTPPIKETAQQPEWHKPSKARLLLRFWQLIAAIGAFGFQVGATPYSGQDMPFSTKGLLYYVYVIDWLSFLFSLFTIYVYLTRRFGKGGKVKRPISFLLDAFFAALFGVGAFYQFALYQCPPGYYDGW
ncbi:hypothetical protein LRAMOSA01902 [Lichtheimia ramosa]|uniref:MARVEL domain-containing protein n=1 Tax=Lichtheimia ramosa TaxID=688394 RepID=A0A077WLB0_9FUNG|nr:hypothetical protein LRAMOSA01902 [Lichtheimia ramosa]